jgi:hypothetical protein
MCKVPYGDRVTAALWDLSENKGLWPMTKGP